MEKGTGAPAGEFRYTLTVTEVKNCRAVRYVLRNKAFRRVFEALNNACSVLPLPVRILHSDNGGKFINHALLRRCGEKGIALTRSRSGKKNDNCFAEQKNGATVRKIAGYGRYSGERGIAALQAVYTPYNRLLNYFYPCMKLLTKERVGSKYRKCRDAAKPPYQRLMERDDVPRDRKLAVIDLKTSASLMEQKSLMDAAMFLLIYK